MGPADGQVCESAHLLPSVKRTATDDAYTQVYCSSVSLLITTGAAKWLSRHGQTTHADMGPQLLKWVLHQGVLTDVPY